MNALYGRLAKFYDKAYSRKDYQNEVEFLEWLFKEFDLEVRNILDVPCGTGNHSMILSKRGYSIVGVDASEEMELKKPKDEERLYIKGFFAHLSSE